jgi:hypothetical protein
MSRNALSIFTEVKTPLGGFDYTISKKLLGSPSNVDDLSLFVRESAQNAWDARLDLGSKCSANFEIHIGIFNEKNAEAFSRDVLIAEKNTADLKTLLTSATMSGCPYIMVRDSGTIGLAGATEADEPSDRRNFISFVRNIGQDTHDANSGGSFGFGKSVFFRYSDQGTIFAYTRTVDENNKQVSRLIGMSLHKAYSDHTGRHWWGTNESKSRGGYNQPLSGDAADDLAKKIGFKPYEKGETGTSIMVISPSFSKHSGASFESLKSSENRRIFAMAVLEALQIWYWPRMMGSGEQDGCLVCNVFCDGKEIEAPTPAERAPLNLYTIAFTEIQKTIANAKYKPDPQITVKYIKRGADEGFGYLAVFKNPKCERAEWFTQQVTAHHPINEALWSQNNNSASCNSVALVRSAGQVVRYLPTAASPLPSNEYGAVFYLYPTGSNATATFREIKASEPVSHDDWSPGSSTLTRYLIGKIRGEIQALIAPNSQVANSSSSRLGRISIMLGGLWGEGEGPGGNPTPRKPSSTSGSSSGGSAKYEAYLAMIDNDACIVVRVLPRMVMPENCKSIIVDTKARAIGGTAMLLHDDGDSGVANVLSEEDVDAGNFIGWFADDPCASKAKPIEVQEELSTESISAEMKKNGFYAVIKNARTFGLSVEIKFIV